MSRVHVRGIELGYDDEGNGPAVMLLHGYPMNRSMWRPQINELKSSHRLVAPDLRGHGESEVASATIEEMARDVEAVMTALEIPSATMVGLSMGGYVTLAFCRLFPLRVRGIVLADTRASADTDEGKKNRAQQRERALSEGMKGIADDMLPKLFAPDTLVRNPQIVEAVRQMILQIKPEGAAAALKAMADRDDQTPFLASIPLPTLIVCGLQDTITPVKDSELMARQIRDAKLVVIENAAHLSNLEQPEQFNRALVEFLQLV